MRGQLSIESYWDKHNEVVPEKVNIKVIQYGLHETMKDKLNLKDEGYCLMSYERFNNYVDNIKHNKMCRRHR